MRILVLLLVVAGSILLSGCVSDNSRSQNRSVSSSNTSGTQFSGTVSGNTLGNISGSVVQVTPQDSKGTTMPDDGKIIVQLKTTEAFKDIQKIIIDTGIIPYFASLITVNFALSQDITINFVETGEEKTSYTAETKEIIISYEYIQRLYERFSATDPANTILYDTSVFTILHEFAYAIIDILEISLPEGKTQEEMADQVSVRFVLNSTVDGQSIDEGAIAKLLTSVYVFSSLTQTIPDNSFTPQRISDMLCRIYGAQPVLTEKVLGPKIQNILSQDTLADCNESYKKLDTSLSPLLSPYMK